MVIKPKKNRKNRKTTQIIGILKAILNRRCISTPTDELIKSSGSQSIGQQEIAGHPY